MGTVVPAYGTTFKKGSLVAGVTSIAIGGISISTIDSTDLADTWKTSTGGEGDGGTIEIGLNVSEAHMTSVFPTPGATPTAMEIDYPGALGKFTFNGLITNFSIDAQQGAGVTGTATVQVSGAVTYVPAA